MLVGLVIFITFLYLVFLLNNLILQGNNTIIENILLSLQLVLVITIPLAIVIYLSNLFYSFIQLTRKEGLTKVHIFSLLVGIAIFIFIISLYLDNKFSNNLVITLISNLIGASLLYFFFLLLVFTISAIVNLIYPRKNNYDYIIILGAGLFKDWIPPILKSRIELGRKHYLLAKKYNKNIKIIVSGGQGVNETIPEALAMANYLIENNIPKDDIIIENQSKNTYENIKFSKAKLSNPLAPCLIATNRFHVFRALVLSRIMHMNCDGVGSKTRLYFTLNAWIRELMATINITKAKYLVIYLIIVIVVIMINIR
jgi:uncharacterized SAM-binding protein YcdF (DUF218 family)